MCVLRQSESDDADCSANPAQLRHDDCTVITAVVSARLRCVGHSLPQLHRSREQRSTSNCRPAKRAAQHSEWIDRPIIMAPNQAPLLRDFELDEHSPSRPLPHDDELLRRGGRRLFAIAHRLPRQLGRVWRRRRVPARTEGRCFTVAKEQPRKTKRNRPIEHLPSTL